MEEPFKNKAEAVEAMIPNVSSIIYIDPMFLITKEQQDQ